MPASVDVNAGGMYAGSDVPRRILLVAPSPPPYGGMALQARLLGKLLQEDGVSVAFFPSNFPFPRWLSSASRVPGLRTLLRFAMIWARLWSAIRQVEIIHILAASWLYFFLTVWPAVLMGRICRKRVVLNYRGGEANDFFRRYRRFVRPALGLADVITVPSAFLAEVIWSHFALPAVIVPNILDFSVFRFKERRVFHPKLLVTRHLEKIYDVESVLKAFRMVQETYPESSLWIAGSGSQEVRLRLLVSQWSLQNVTFLGHVAHCDLPRIYDQCDILVNGSRVDNFPGALLEASAAGLVVVSTNAGGIPFIYEDGKDAMLVSTGDWEALGRAVQKVLADPSLAADLTKVAALVARNCEWTEVRKRLYTVYGFPCPERINVGVMKCVVG
jgi:glycosyltransferase involved in cell wall biosynthesis